MYRNSVDILMSIYKPNVNWFIEQLESLNNQTYKNIKVIIWNDCPEDKTDYLSIISRQITKFKFSYLRGEKNLGATKAFEYLTTISTAEYVAYCDQDDVWLDKKIDQMIEKINDCKADLVCSDMYVIDKDGVVTANSIKKLRPKQTFSVDSNLKKYILTNNYVYGCACLVKRDVALSSFPVERPFYHDWWIALYVVYFGKICVINEPLIKYRIHGTNQTVFLSGINTKEDYFKSKILDFNNKMDSISKRITNTDIYMYKKYASARIENFEHFSLRTIREMWKYRNIEPKRTAFEIILPILPEFAFSIIIKVLKYIKK